jgi:DNA-binding NarL/FixJ family response regulator
MIAAFVDDLLFRSKIRAVASHTGAAVSFLRAPDDPALAEAAMAIVDLDGPAAVATVSALRAAWPALRVVGFVSHVHAERIRDARAAGATEVMARSAFVNALPELLRADS